MPRIATSKPLIEEAFADRRRDPDTKREAILRTAVRLFLHHGYARTSLTDVAQQLNITKPALYHYFHNKEDILLECYRWGFSLIQGKLDEAAAGCGTGLEKVTVFIHAYASVITTDFASCFVRLDDRDLSEEARQEVRQCKRNIDRRLRSFIQEGNDDGTIAGYDPKIGSLIVAGAVTSICAWYEPKGRLPAEAIVQQVVRTLTQGLAR